jgi:hypothetical protein
VTQFHAGQLGGDECLSLLSRTNIGRIGLVIGPLPFVYPVRYGVEKGHIVFGVSFNEVAAALNDAVVALQADGFEEDQGCHWTVLAIGPASAMDVVAEDVAPHERSEHRSFRLRPKMISGYWLDETGEPF